MYGKSSLCITLRIIFMLRWLNGNIINYVSVEALLFDVLDLSGDLFLHLGACGAPYHWYRIARSSHSWDEPNQWLWREQIPNKAPQDRLFLQRPTSLQHIPVGVCSPTLSDLQHLRSHWWNQAHFYTPTHTIRSIYLCIPLYILSHQKYIF